VFDFTGEPGWDFNPTIKQLKSRKNFLEFTNLGFHPDGGEYFPVPIGSSAH
jgi:hypothetical protein